MDADRVAAVAAVASALAAVMAVLVAIITVLLLPLGRRFLKLLHTKWPKHQLIRVTSVMSRMDDVKEFRNIFGEGSTMTLRLEGFGECDRVFLVAEHPWVILAITQAFEDHNWEIEMDRLRARFSPGRHTEGEEVKRA